MSVEILDAGVAMGWLQRRHRSFDRLEKLFSASRAGRIALWISTVNIAEVLIHTTEMARSSGVDPIALLRGFGIKVHQPDEAVARRVASSGLL